MEMGIQRINAGIILRRLTKTIAHNGFTRTKPTFWVREKELTAEFLHIHKFSGSPSFRIHVCLRVLNDPSEFINLAGIDSDIYGMPSSPNGKKYNFYYHKSEETITCCVRNITEFVNEVAEPWFESCENMRYLTKSRKSPLYADGKDALKHAVRGFSIQSNIENSRSLLKLRK